MTATVTTDKGAASVGDRRLMALDPRRLTAPYPVAPLLVLMGINACLLMGGALLALQLVGIQDDYHSALVVLSGAVVQQIQLGLGLDLPVAAAANRWGVWRFAVGGAVLFGAFAAVLGVAGLATDTVVLYFGVFLVIAISTALTSTQHGALAQYYPAEVRTRAVLAHRCAGVTAIALAAPVAYLFGGGFSWQAPYLALAGVALVVAVIGSRVLPFGHPSGPLTAEATVGADATPGAAPPGGGGPDGRRLALDAPPTLPEATRVLFLVPSVRTLYQSLPFVSVTFFGVAYYAGLLYLNVLHQDADGRRLALDVSAGGAALGVLLAALVLPRLFRRDPAAGMRTVAAGALVAAAATAVLALAPTLGVTVAAEVGFSAAAGWVVAGVYAALSVVLPVRLMTLGYALSSLWFLLGVFVIGPVGTIGSTLAAVIGNDFGFQASFWLFVPLLLAGAALLRRSSRSIAEDIARLDASVRADLEARRDRLEGRGKLLMARGIEGGYDGVKVLFGVDFDVDDGEMVAVLGTNGAGKSTFVKSLCGLLLPTAGEVLFDGQPITTLDTNRIVKLGITMVPGDRGIFPGLTTADNLKMAGWLYDKDAAYVREATESVLGYFPNLRRRLATPAGSLSGGEQQMLSLAMAFIARPRLMIIDELSLGLAPAVIESLLGIVKAINERGTAVILVEQSVNLALRMCSRAIFMEKGRVVYQGPTADLLQHPEIVRSVLLEGARQHADEGTGMAARAGDGIQPATDAGAGALAATSLGRLRTDPRAPASRLEPRADEGGIVLSARGIVKRFGGVVAVDDVDLDLEAGEVLGLIGPNGAGKTTLFEIISGQLRPNGGRTTMHGTDISAWPAHRRAAFGLGRSFQAARLWGGLTVEETVALAVSRQVRSPGVVATMLCSPTVGRAEKRVRASADEVVDMLGLGAYKDQLGADLSTGLRRMLELAVIVAQRPSIVLLDEPSAGLAQAETEALGPVLDDIRAGLGCSVMLIEHDMGLIRALADRIIALDTGAVVAVGQPEEVLRDPRVVDSYLGAAATV